MKPLRVFLTLLIPLLAGIGLSLLLNPGDQLTDPGPTISQSTRADSLDAEVIAPQPIDQNDPLTDSLLPTTWIPSSQEEVVLFLHGIRSLRDVGGHFNMNLANVLLAGVSSREPQLVLELLLEPESEPLHRSCLPTLLNVWAANDLSGALEHIRGISAGPLRDELEFRLLNALAEQDPESAKSPRGKWRPNTSLR